MDGPNLETETMTTATKQGQMIVKCENGHRQTFYWKSESDPRSLHPEGPCGEFASGEYVYCESRDSYAYTHGGCCYRAAVDALHDLT